MITKKQIIMALEKLGWSNVELSLEAGLHRNTIYNALNSAVQRGTLSLIKIAFEEHGIKFTNYGCYLKKSAKNKK